MEKWEKAGLDCLRLEGSEAREDEAGASCNVIRGGGREEEVLGL